MPLTIPKQSDTCLIRDFEKNDVPLIADIEFDTETKRFVGLPEGTKEQWIEKASGDVELLYGWVVTALPENEVAGRVSLKRAKDQAPGVVEFEIIIGKKFWGRGLGTEVASMIIPAVFCETNVKAIRAEVHPDNKASLALLDRFGFKYAAQKEPMLLYELNRSGLAYNNSLKGDRQKVSGPLA